MKMITEGRETEIRVITQHLRSKNKILIELDDDRPLAQIAAEMDGLASFKIVRGDAAGVYEMYEGYDSLISIQKTETGRVRLTLERRDAA